jgi:hypothetical protein
MVRVPSRKHLRPGPQLVSGASGSQLVVDNAQTRSTAPVGKETLSSQVRPFGQPADVTHVAKQIETLASPAIQRKPVPQLSYLVGVPRS